MRKNFLLIAAGLILSLSSFGQFEEAQNNGTDFEKLKVRLGADFAMQ